jgi:hypothetical protein
LENVNKIINGLWIGKTLSTLELLCIKSFIAHGHEFNLWAYDEIENQLPDGLVLKNAAEIIPREKVFNYKNKNQFGHGKGSYAGFSDIFRYKLLFVKGGWWVDMDVCCLKPFDFAAEYVFRSHHDFPVVGNIMKCPVGSELMNVCYNETISEVDSGNKNWNKPIEILNHNIIKLKLENYIVSISNADNWRLVRKLIRSDRKIPDSWFAIHWINEEWRANHIDRKAINRKSTLGKLLVKYQLFEESERIPLLKNSFRLSLLGLILQKSPLFIPKSLWSFLKYYFNKIIGKM